LLRHKIAPGFAFIVAACAALSLGSPALAQPVITITPQLAAFNYTPGGAVPGPQQILVTSDIAARLQTYTISYGQGGDWLTVFPPPNNPLDLLGPSGGVLTLYIKDSVTSLAPGTYSAAVNLTVTPAPAGSSSLTITVFLQVGPGGGGGNQNEMISVAPTALAFAFQPGAAIPAAQAVAVTTSDNATVTAVGITDDGAPWLIVSPSSSVTPGTINVSVNPAMLTGGTYTGNVTVKAPNNVAQIPVTLTVGTSGLAVTPSSISINEPQNYGVSAPQPLTILAATPIPLMINSSALDGGNWLQVDVNNAVAPATVNVRANDSGLAQGTYMGTITVQSGPSNSATVPVTLVVGPPATLSLSPGSLTFVYQINDPAPLTQSTKVGSLNGAAQTFTATPVTNDGGKWLTSVPSPATTPGAVVVGIAPAGLGVGTYTGVVNVTSSAANASPQPILVTLIVKPAPIPTVLSVTSAASYATGAVAPGELVTIFGSSIGPANLTIAPSGTAPQSLANTGVTFDGIPAPIYYVSSTQSTVQVPYNIVPGQTVMKVSYNAVSSVGTTIPSVPASPGLFTSDSSGQRQIAALNDDLSVNSAGNPATRGKALVLYGTGEGQTSPASVEGSRVPTVAPLPQTPLQVLVSIGGQIAQVAYAGETPGLLSGLMQINVTVPANAPVGANVPVVVSINGRSTQNNATVAIK
jgi:uncharacterized protein (TIGR03437 family)